MPRYRTEITVPRRPEEVFDYLARFSSAARVGPERRARRDAHAGTRRHRLRVPIGDPVVRKRPTVPVPDHCVRPAPFGDARRRDRAGAVARHDHRRARGNGQQARLRHALGLPRSRATGNTDPRAHAAPDGRTRRPRASAPRSGNRRDRAAGGCRARALRGGQLLTDRLRGPQPARGMDATTARRRARGTRDRRDVGHRPGHRVLTRRHRRHRRRRGPRPGTRYRGGEGDRRRHRQRPRLLRARRPLGPVGSPPSSRRGSRGPTTGSTSSCTTRACSVATINAPTTASSSRSPCTWSAHSCSHRYCSPCSRPADAPRVITMSSGGMYTQRLDVGALDPIAGEYDGVRAYARAKRAQVELTRLWEQHEGPTGVRFVSMHPGWVATPGIESSLPSFNRLMRPILRTAEEGADTAVWLAASPDSQLAGVASGSIDTPVGNIACPGRTPRPAKRLDSGPGASPGREERQHRRLNSAEWRRRSVVERHEVELSETVGDGDQFDLDDAARRRSCSRRRPAGVPPGPHEPHRSVQQPRSGGVRPPRELRSQGPSPTHPCGAGRSDPRPGATFPGAHNTILRSLELTRSRGHLIFPRFSALGFLGW